MAKTEGCKSGLHQYCKRRVELGLEQCSCECHQEESNER